MSKESPVIEAIGTIDELNSALGVVVSELGKEALRPALLAIQHDLFELGGDIYRGEAHLPVDQRVAAMEQTIDRLNEALGPLEEFILPGGCRPAASCHLARAICRRAERRVVAMINAGHPDTGSARYLNRLSDLLFVVARTINRRLGDGEQSWRPLSPGQPEQR